MSETNDLINITKHITILTNGEKAPEIRADNVKISEKEIREIRGEQKVEEIQFTDNTTIKTDGIFIAQGIIVVNLKEQRDATFRIKFFDVFDVLADVNSAGRGFRIRKICRHRGSLYSCRSAI